MQLAGDAYGKLLQLRLLWLLGGLEWPNPQTSVSLFMLNGLFVPLSPLLLHDELHFPLGVFDNGSSDFDYIG